MEVINFLPALPHVLHHWAHGIAQALPFAQGAIEWIVNATLAGIFGIILGFVIAQFVGLWHRFRPAKANH
jgi:uncharacterized protein